MKQRPNSVANLARKNGAQIPPLNMSKEICERELNPLDIVNNHEADFLLTYQNYDMLQVCSSMVWDNLPPNIFGWNLNRMLYYRGALAGFEYNGVIYVLPYTIEGGINIAGLPNKIRPITFNGEAPTKNDGNPFGAPLLLDVANDGEYNSRAEAFILYDSIPFSPASLPLTRFYVDQVYLRQICNTLSKVDVNIQISNKKIFLIIPDLAQARSVQRRLESAFKSDSPFIVINSPIETDSVQQVSDFNADMLFQTAKNWDAIRCKMNGIEAKGFGSDKKERMITGELAGEEMQVNLISDMRLDLAREWADKMNKAFNLNISVRKRSDDYEQETDGNGKTSEEEEDLSERSE